MIGVAALHERWFIPDDGLPTRWTDVLDPGTGLAIAAAVGVVVLVTAAWLARGRRPILPGTFELGATEERLAVVLGWMPLLLAVHTAVPLLVSGIQGQLLVPNLTMELPVSAFVGLAEVGLGLLLFYGVFARYAGYVLVLVWGVGVLIFGPVRLLEQAIFLGIGLFFVIVGRGPLAVDRLFGRWAGARERWLHHAVPILRITTGFSFAWLAFTEKLLNLPLGLAFLDRYPFVNFLPGMADANFLRVAGAVELTAGLLLIIGAFPRLVILVLWLPFNLTLTLFGWRELVGHLPIYAVMAVVLMWGNGGNREVRALRAGLVPVREKPLDAARKP